MLYFISRSLNQRNEHFGPSITVVEILSAGDPSFVRKNTTGSLRKFNAGLHPFKVFGRSNSPSPYPASLSLACYAFSSFLDASLALFFCGIAYWRTREFVQAFDDISFDVLALSRPSYVFHRIPPCKHTCKLFSFSRL